MAYVSWLLFLSALTGAGIVLRRRLLSRRIERQIQAVRLATELGRQLKLIPGNLLSWPMRDGCGIILENTARLIDGSPLASLADGLRHDARLLRANRATPSAALLPANIRRLFENLERPIARASAMHLIEAREYALAHSAVLLAMELAGVDILVQEARVAAVLKEKYRSEHLKAQALARCARLPEKTAEEVRKRVRASVAA